VRRSPGTGTAARFRKDGRYECRVTIGHDHGRQVQRSYFGATAKEAERKRDEGLRQLAGGIILAGEKVTVERYLRDWLEVKRASIRASTWTRYHGIVEHNIIPAIGSVPLAKLRPETVERMLSDAVKTLSPRTAHHIRAVLRTALGRAVKHGELSRNVAEHADAPRVEEVEQQILTPHEIHRFLTQIEGDRWEALYIVAIATGLRQGEILGLRWQDLEAGSLRVVNQMYQRKLVPPKTAKSRRQVGIGPSVLAALNAHRLRQEQQRRFMVREGWGNDDGLIFTNGMGGPIHGPHVTREFQRHLARAGLPRLPFHSLRHLTSSMLLSLGVDEKVRQQILGHSNAAMNRQYTHVLMPSLRDAADRMEQVLAGS
jgi:integrase